MNKLYKGAVSFRKKDFETHKALFGDLSNSQNLIPFYWMLGFPFGAFAYNFHSSRRVIYNT